VVIKALDERGYADNDGCIHASIIMPATLLTQMLSLFTTDPLNVGVAV